MKKKMKAAKEDDSMDHDTLKAEYKGKVAEFNQQIREARKAYRKAKWQARLKVWKEWRAEKRRVRDLIREVKKDLPDVKERLSEAKREKRELRKSLLAAGKSGDALKNDDKYKKAIAHVEEIELEKEIIDDHVSALKENLRRYKKVTKREAREHALRIMREVGIPQPKKRFRQYPFQFSGGMRQRIVIAIALTANPDILICDEPTTALDVTIQAQILDLINDLKEKRNLSVIFITHDLGVVANMADRIAVMYAGKIVEYGTSEEIFYDPKHPYTWALMSSVPDLDSKEKLVSIPGTPPNMLFPPKGDAFADRNQYAMKIDFEEEPPMFKISDTHYAATWLLHKDAPEVEMPEIVKTRIKRMLDEHEEAVKEVKENG
jgi:oligopeptide transport system ATP-binding protein